MGTTTTQLGLQRPVGADSDNVPSDVTALTDRLEAILADGHDSLWSLGDIKYNGIKTADHGRWLLCDGRELTQAQIESALGLAAGKAAAFATALGTGGTSKYGAAATGKVKLPDGRDKFLLGTHSTGTHTLGQTGGAERVTLAATESGVAVHNHGTTESPHNHTQNAHTHTLTIATGATGISATHAHTHTQQGTFTSVGESAPHSHVQSAEFVTTTVNRFAITEGSGATAQVYGDAGTAVNKIGASSGGNSTGNESVGHTHDTTIGGATAGASTSTVSVSDPSHGHPGSTAANATATNNATTTGLSVNNATAAPAAASHENLPPYLGIGSPFIRV